MLYLCKFSVQFKLNYIYAHFIFFMYIIKCVWLAQCEIKNSLKQPGSFAIYGNNTFWDNRTSSTVHHCWNWINACWVLRKVLYKREQIEMGNRKSMWHYIFSLPMFSTCSKFISSWPREVIITFFYITWLPKSSQFHNYFELLLQFAC